MDLSILNVFNRYRLAGGEEYAVNRMCRHLSARHQVHLCEYDSKEWLAPGAPGKASQAARLFYNPDGRRRFESLIQAAKPDLALFHNLYPIGSPALYPAAQAHNLPVLQFLHNYRPFSVGGSLYSRGQIFTDPLYGHYRREVQEAAWMNSRLRSALMAFLLKLLHRSRWLDAVTTWVAISDFMRVKLIESGAVHPDRIVTLRHAWDALPEAPPPQDAGHYLFLGRLIPEKGIPMLLQAWDQIYSKLGKATPRLHIAGEGPLADKVRDHARHNPYICALGQTSGEAKADQLTKCRAVIIPSVWWEPLGLVTYEAYDYAKPVLAARSGGLGETVHPGKTGLLHEPGRVEGLVNDVLAMEAMTPASRAALGASGRHWLKQETDPNLWLRRFENIASEAIQRVKARRQK